MRPSTPVGPRRGPVAARPVDPLLVSRRHIDLLRVAGTGCPVR